jgi:hypothetical protein
MNPDDQVEVVEIDLGALEYVKKSDDGASIERR